MFTRCRRRYCIFPYNINIVSLDLVPSHFSPDPEPSQSYTMKLFSKASALLALHASVAAAANSVANTVLVFARDSASANVATLGLQGYGIPYQTVLVPQTGAALPVLNSSSTQGNYGGILVLSEVSYQYSTGFLSALNASQWQTLYDYQTAFGVRMVRLDVYPTPDMGKPTPPAMMLKPSRT